MSRILSATIQLEDDVAKANTFVHGDEKATYTAKDGTKVRSIRNLQQEAEVNIDAAKGAATSADLSASKAEAAATAAQVGSGLFLTVNEGIAATQKDDLFNVVDRTNENYILLYKNNGDKTAVELKRYPSSEAVLDKSPFLGLIRNGVSSSRHMGFTSFISDALVVGAEEGKYYRIAYFQNMADLNGVVRDSWIIEEIDSSEFEISGSAARIISTDTASPHINRDAENQCIILKTHRRPSLSLVLSIKPRLLPARGVLSSQASSGAGYSWIINPTKYIQKHEEEIKLPGKTSDNQVLVEYLASQNKLTVTFDRDKTHKLRITLQPNGFNNLFNVRSVEVADKNSEEFETISLSNTDWFPPLVVESKKEPYSVGVEKIYTGGNHGSSGGAGGEMTARMKNIEVFTNGQLALDDTLKYADSVEVKWVNELMAYNTISQNRYVLDQYFSIVITKNNIEAWSEVVANEDIVIHTDNACQMTSTGFDSIFYMNGEDMSSSTPISQNSTSGSARNAPSCFAAVLKGDVKSGLQISWIDNNYGLGKDPQIGGTAAKFRRGTGTNSKIYSAAVSNRAYARSKGESYQWHGGYTWAGLDGFAGIENAFLIHNKNDKYLAYATSLLNLSGTVQYPLLNIGDVVDDNTVGASGSINVHSASPFANLLKIES